MKRLGAPMWDCANCNTVFSVKRLPRYWIHTYVNGTLQAPVRVAETERDGTDPHPEEPILCCSKECSEQHARRLRKERPTAWNPQESADATLQYIPWVETGNP
jgi:hypothetical protein